MDYVYIHRVHVRYSCLHLSLIALREFSEEEKLQVMHSENFQLFIDHSSRLVERAFASDRDLFIDYKGLESKGDRCESLD